MSTRLELLKRYLQEDPSDSFLRYAVALEFMSMNEEQNAYDQLVNLLNDEPYYLAAYYMAGKLAEVLGKKSDAIAWYEKGIEVARQQKEQKTMDELATALELLED